MKNIYRLSAVSLIASLALACGGKEEVREPEPKPEIKINVTIGDFSSRLSYTSSGDGLKSGWEAGDKLSLVSLVNGTVATVDLLTAQGSGKTVEFSGTYTGRDGADLICIYPPMNEGLFSLKTTYLMLNCSQPYTAVQKADGDASHLAGTDLMIGRVSGTDAVLEKKSNVLRLSLSVPEMEAGEKASYVSFMISGITPFAVAAGSLSLFGKPDRWTSTAPQGNVKLGLGGMSAPGKTLTAWIPAFLTTDAGNLQGSEDRKVTWRLVTDRHVYESYAVIPETEGEGMYPLAPGEFYSIGDVVMGKTDIKPGDEDKEPEAPDRKSLFDTDLFTKVTDSSSGVVSYFLKNELFGFDNSQSNYFVSPAMTDDERFIFFFVSPNEFKNMSGGKHNTETKGMILDLLKGKFYVLEGVGRDCYPYLDPVEDKLYFMRRASDKNSGIFYRRDLLTAPEQDVRLADFPRSILPQNKNRSIKRGCSHITLTRDRKKVFIDARIDNTFYQGLLDLYTGEWDQWGHTEYDLTHGQLNPADDNLALCSGQEFTDTDNVTTHPMHYDPADKCFPYAEAWKFDNVYPRINFVTRTSRITVKPDPEENYATHDCWSADGDYVFWCSRGIHVRDRRTGAYRKVYSQTKASHCFFSKAMDYVTFDDSSQGGYYRGCKWRVGFFNCKTQKRVWIHTLLPQIAEESDESSIHPDPHPHFVCNDKYIVCTAATADRNIHVSITPVGQLLEKTK